jgi:hypothetical protein
MEGREALANERGRFAYRSQLHLGLDLTQQRHSITRPGPGISYPSNTSNMPAERYDIGS